MLSDFLEAVVVMLPAEAGGRAGAVSPRDGNYCPFARDAAGPLLRVRFIEGPPTLAPGEAARVVMEIEAGRGSFLMPGAELDLVEPHSGKAGVITVSRVWRASL